MKALANSVNHCLDIVLCDSPSPKADRRGKN